MTLSYYFDCILGNVFPHIMVKIKNHHQVPRYRGALYK